MVVPEHFADETPCDLANYFAPKRVDGLTIPSC